MHNPTRVSEQCRAQFFEREGCRMVEMACEEHDRIAAGSQFITHTIGRVLGAMEPKPSAIDTRGYEVRARGTACIIVRRSESVQGLSRELTAVKHISECMPALCAPLPSYAFLLQGEAVQSFSAQRVICLSLNVTSCFKAV